MIKKSCFIVLVLTLYCIVCHGIYEKSIKITKKENNPSITIKETQEKDQIGYLKIDKINLYEPLYEKNSKKNNIEEHVTILKESKMPEEENSIIFLAAHSGTGKIAYFENLDELTIGDKIEISYHNTKYYYQISNIWEENKTGYIHVNQTNKKQLILTTCSPKKDDKQLVISSNLI